MLVVICILFIVTCSISSHIICLYFTEQVFRLFSIITSFQSTTSCCTRTKKLKPILIMTNQIILLDLEDFPDFLETLVILIPLQDLEDLDDLEEELESDTTISNES